jgi:hypothetical protein
VKGFSVQQISVPAISLETLLDSFNGRDIHWMKVDVEGMEYEVLHSWGACSVRPWILVIESTYPLSQVPTQHQWINEVTSRGYDEVYFDGLNRYFVKVGASIDRMALALPPNVFDGFVLAGTHWAGHGIHSAAAMQLAAIESERQHLAALHVAELSAVEQARAADAAAIADQIAAERDNAARLETALALAVEQQRQGAEQLLASEETAATLLRDAQTKASEMALQAQREFLDAVKVAETTAEKRVREIQLEMWGRFESERALARERDGGVYGTGPHGC